MAFSTESISQPHDMSGTSSMDRFVCLTGRNRAVDSGMTSGTRRGGKEKVRCWVRRQRCQPLRLQSLGLQIKISVDGEVEWGRKIIMKP